MASIIEITNPLTGAVEQVDKLDHTAQEIDSAVSRALPGGGIDAALALKAPLESPALTGTPTINGVPAANVGQLCNPNLLDNWYFANPVNQRGQTSYTGAGYGIDRWKSHSSTLTVLSQGDGMRFLGNGFVLQKLEQDFSGKTLTVSVLLNNGKLCIGTGVMPQEGAPNNDVFYETGVFTLFFEHVSGAVNALGFAIPENSDLHILAAKLELGTQQTLAHQDADGNWQLVELPNYADTFLRCVSSTADPSDPYANVPQRRNNRVIAVNTVNGLTTTVYSNDVTVTISILGKPTESISTNTALCRMLPERYRPPIDYYVRSFFDDGTSNVVGVAHSGYVTNPLADIKAGSYHRAIFTYSI